MIYDNSGKEPTKIADRFGSEEPEIYDHNIYNLFREKGDL